MQAIVTKYLGPTNHRGARIKATAQAGSITLSWDHALNADDNHQAAASELARRKGWAGVWVGGWLPSGKGRAFTCLYRGERHEVLDCYDTGRIKHACKAIAAKIQRADTLHSSNMQRAKANAIKASKGMDVNETPDVKP